MTDDELDRALFALPLEEAPVDLHARILSATIYRPRIDVRTWEVWAVGTAVALAVWLSVLVLTGVPDAGERIAHSMNALIPSVASAFTSATTLWLGLGITVAVWMSQLSVPQRSRRIAEE
jgi:hypothetical protein